MKHDHNHILGEHCIVDREEQKKLLKEAYKEASREWMQELSAAFGRWALLTIAGGAVAAIGYAMLMLNGWHR